MMYSKKIFFLVLLAALLAMSSAGIRVVDAEPYKSCGAPAVVGFATKPNIMIVMDYSGSMQFPAYFPDNWGGYYGSYVADCHDTSESQTYDQSETYYGLFHSDKYYVYNATDDHFELDGTPPVTAYDFTAVSADGGGGTIEYTAAGHTFVVGDLVAIYGLTSHENLNGKAYTVAAVNGDKFKITAPWNGIPDAASGNVQKRVSGNAVTGLSGNILNFATTSRIDAALKALIGGRADCPTGDYCYVRGQGSRRFLGESTNLNVDFDVWPATLAAPNDYAGGTYTTKTTFVSINGHYSGTLSAADPVYYSKYFEQYSFTLTATTRVKISLTGTWAGDDMLGIYTVPIVHNGDDNTNRIQSDSGSPAEISATLAAGTYYVRATSNDNGMTGSYVLGSNVPLTPYEQAGFTGTNQGTAQSTIGELASARVRIKIPKEQRRGVIQNTFNQARYGFMYYNTTSGNLGKILVGTDNDSLTTLTDALDTIFPYNGTPTGPALEEALDYFKQSNDHSNADNSAFIGSGTVKDPYYDVNAAGTAVAVPCRKSYVVVISDGEWNNGADPIIPALGMHVGDLRTGVGAAGSDFEDQNVGVFSIFAFSTVLGGQNAMRAVAMYGGFEEIASCGTTGYPFNETATPNSLSMSWPRPDCDPAGTYNDACCAEWDKKWDLLAPNDNLGKGVPDNYYNASDGAQVELALTEVISSVLQGNSAASAVATVSQQIPGGDIIVRGAFEAGNSDPRPASPQDYLWYGHIEAYLPFYDSGEFKYAFDECCNIGLLCKDDADASSGCGPCASATLPGKKHCWDAATEYKAGLNVPTARNVFTYLDLEEDFLTTDFILSNLTTNLNDLDMTQDVKTSLTSGETKFWSQALEIAEAEVVDLLSWVLGMAPVKDGGAVDARDRYKYRYRGDDRWILADIVYSTPVLVGTPSFGSVSTNLDIKVDPSDTYTILDEFYKYRTKYLYRSRVVYVGANDGMLHAYLAGEWDTGRKRWFYSDDPNHYTIAEDQAVASNHSDIGKELWAFIPWNVLSTLKELADWGYADKECTHCTTVDLAPQAWDVYIKSDECAPAPSGTDYNGDGRCWRTVIVGGERGGGDRYFAIDVTDPTNPKVLWDYSVLRDRVVAVPTTSPAFEYRMPFDDHYSTLKLLPMSWSRPYVGRLKIPLSVAFRTGDPEAGVAKFWKDPETGSTVEFSDSLLREVAFIGGGFRIFDENLSLPTSVTGSAGWDYAWKSLFFPHFLALDIETGQNLFKYVWPLLVKDYSGVDSANTPQFFPENRGAVSSGSSNFIPYGMSDVLALDVLNELNMSDASCTTDPSGTQATGSDGYVDHVYVGDLNGNLYGIKFNLHPCSTSKGVMIDIRRTKPVALADGVNDFRTRRQPVSVGLSASIDGSDTNSIRVLFGAGKYDNVDGDETDKTDKAHMSFYNMKEPLMLPSITGPGSTFDQLLTTANPGFNLRIRHCLDCIESLASDADKNYQTDCRYVQSDGSADCCEGSPRNCGYQSGSPPNEQYSCWDCILDLGAVSFVDDGAGGFTTVNPFGSTDGGERVVDKALIAGGLVFFTTYVPNTDPCNPGGQGFLYVLKYNCREITAQERFLLGVNEGTIRTGDVSTGTIGGFRLGLGTGVPSRPVLDSTGEHVFIQLSTGEIKKIKVDLPDKPVKAKGWRER